MIDLKGVIPVIPTPFSDDGLSVDLDCVEKLTETAIQDGASAVTLFGAGAEFYKLSDKERDDILTAVLRTNAGRVPVVATVTEHATCLAIRQALSLKKAGVDVINIFPPHFAAPSAAAICRHFLDVIQAVDMPVMIQHAPQYTGSELADEVYHSLAQHTKDGGYVNYIKVESDPTGPAITRLKKSVGSKMNILIGNGGLKMLEALDRGACAVMPGSACVRAYANIYNAYASGDRATAKALYNRMLPYLNALGQSIEYFVSYEKMILEARGILKNHICRKPNVEPDKISMAMVMETYCDLQRASEADRI